MPAPCLPEQYEDQEKREYALKLGFWAFLGSETLLFSGLFVLYAAYRTMYRGDFTDAIAHNTIYIGSANTIILITSSFFVALSIWAVRKNRLRLIPIFLSGTIALGLSFLVLKAIEYTMHYNEGYLPGHYYRNAEFQSFGAQKFWTMYWVMTGLHSLHVIAGLCALVWILYRSTKRAYDASYHTPLELGALYWHLVDVIWIFIWPLLYLGGS